MPQINLTFLGTGDNIPSRARNPTSILLRMNEENILFDCGEGTQRQFRKAGLNPCKITRILITHWHGDHILGLPGLLSTLAISGYNKTLYIYGPNGIKEKIKKTLEVFNFFKNYEIKVEELKSGLFYEDKNFYLSCEEMEHGIPTLAYSFVNKGNIRIDKDKLKKSGLPEGPILQKLKDGKDVSYEGKKFKSKDLVYKDLNKKISVVLDTKLNKKIIPFVKNSDILIAEGTYSKELSKEAEEHFHLTISQAAEIAKKSTSKKLILTHISSRYSKEIKTLLSEANEIFNESYLVKDLEKIEL
ncbi:ribonuclease Z [Candidatus Pacearchaeota archaeon]|nr:ribonuclease Z [Candidatus Pacearchaeota archaeon]PIN71388.1 MAG: ribonuclease Z [Candidatus Pacearchaeota archaeon CG11_big_fil_rev_8_21_14_0_20_30_13]PIZ81996.1 MAG: ribonuclease Z [Candidatus Pacearchaeota archaeon CG_4_10_14_0_2_um_filter_30_11]PJA71114.1 MAG: ribonuclease Z [Candidatus Pacearchaeota archaeon CG_4_9_14_3_um_filter_30_11]